MTLWIGFDIFRIGEGNEYGPSGEVTRATGPMPKVNAV